MSMEHNWYPMQWPCGPLEARLRKRSSNGDRGSDDSLSSWLDPASLDLLRGTPINCLVLPWSAGLPEDKDQQRRLQPLLAAARSLELHGVGRVMAGDLEAEAVRAQAAGLTALAMENIPQARLSLPVIQWAALEKVRWNSAPPVLSLVDAVWPGIRGNGGAGAGW